MKDNKSEWADQAGRAPARCPLIANTPTHQQAQEPLRDAPPFAVRALVPVSQATPSLALVLTRQPSARAAGVTGQNGWVPSHQALCPCSPPVLDMQQTYDMWLKKHNPGKPGEGTPISSREGEKQIQMPTDYADIMVMAPPCRLVCAFPGVGVGRGSAPRQGCEDGHPRWLCPQMGYHCWLCGKNSNSKKQWQQHIQSEKHKEKVFTSDSDASGWAFRFPMGEFRLCDRCSREGRAAGWTGVGLRRWGPWPALAPLGLEVAFRGPCVQTQLLLDVRRRGRGGTWPDPPLQPWKAGTCQLSAGLKLPERGSSWGRLSSRPKVRQPVVDRTQGWAVSLPPPTGSRRARPAQMGTSAAALTGRRSSTSGWTGAKC